MDVGAVIRSLRKERGVKSGDLAKAVGVSSSYISRIENENRRLSTPIILRIAEALSVDPSVLMDAARQDGRDLRLRKSVDLLLSSRMLNPRFVNNLFNYLGTPPVPSHETDAWGSDALECALALHQSLQAKPSPAGAEDDDPPSDWPDDRKTGWVRNRLMEFIGQIDFFEAVLEEKLFLPDAAAGPGSFEFRKNPGAGGLPSIPVVSQGDDIARAGQLPALDMLGDAAGERLFAFAIADNSMFPVYEPGSHVLFSMDRQAKNGDRVVACLRSGKLTCKILRQKSDWIQLVSLNPVMEPLFLKEAEIRWMHPVNRSIGK